jgi:hypothetical protein
MTTVSAGHHGDSGKLKNQLSHHSICRSLAARRMRSRFIVLGASSPFSHRETVACEVPANAANSACVTWNMELRM